MKMAERLRHRAMVAPLLNAGMCLWEADTDSGGVLRDKAEELIRLALSHMKLYATPSAESGKP